MRFRFTAGNRKIQTPWHGRIHDGVSIVVSQRGFSSAYSRVAAVRSVVRGQQHLALSQTAGFPVPGSSADEAVPGKIQCGGLATSRCGQNSAEYFLQGICRQSQMC